MRRTTLPLIVFVVLICAGCATLRSDFETPAVSITTFRPLEEKGLSPKFEIGLHIVNPNRSQLKIQGIACTLAIDGYDLLTGVSNDIPVIDGYGEGDVTVTATASLMQSIRLFADIVNKQRDGITYKLKAKLDLGGAYPSIRVEEKGAFTFTGSPRQELKITEE